jgi:hypothetical protein
MHIVPWFLKLPLGFLCKLNGIPRNNKIIRAKNGKKTRFIPSAGPFEIQSLQNDTIRTTLADSLNCSVRWSESPMQHYPSFELH